MTKPKKRPNKAAKAAQKVLSESKLLSDAKAAGDAANADGPRNSVVSPRVNTKAIKPRPDKKRG